MQNIRRAVLLIKFFFPEEIDFSLFLSFFSLNKRSAWAVWMSLTLRSEMVVPKVGRGRGRGEKKQARNLGVYTRKGRSHEEHESD